MLYRSNCFVHATIGLALLVQGINKEANKDIDERQRRAELITAVQRFWGSLAQSISSNLSKIRQKQALPELPSASPSEKRNIALTQDGQRPQAWTLSPQNGRDSDDMPWLQCHDSATATLREGEPHIGMILDVYHYDAEESGATDQQQQYSLAAPAAQGTCGARFVNRYELLEPLHLKLGTTVKHAMDFAYMPVLADQVEPISAHQQAQFRLHQKEATVNDGVDESGTRTPDAALLNPRQVPPPRGAQEWWWQWWVPWRSWDASQDHWSNYRMHNHAFAGGSHGEVWRGRRRCGDETTDERGDEWCNKVLIFKRLRVENGYRVLEAGLREVHFGKWLADQIDEVSGKFTKYLDHFFREQNGALELWIVFENGGPSLRSFLYTGKMYGDFVVYQHSFLWTELRMSMADSNHSNALPPVADSGEGISDEAEHDGLRGGGSLMKDFLKQILEAAAFLHSSSIVHRDIKPSNVLCKTNIQWDDTHVVFPEPPFPPFVDCVLGDLSSAWDVYSDEYLYTGGPSRLEQTDEYAPPEALFGKNYTSPDPAFDSWSIGIVALELLLGTPNVFTVDQRTKAVLTQKMKKKGASNDEIERALYLAALSQFCIYNQKTSDWPLRQGDPLHKLNMVKQRCTLHDFQRALHARDPLGVGFDTSTDTLLHLIWQLLAFDPHDRMTAAEALNHPYFGHVDVWVGGDQFRGDSQTPGEHNAIESQMLDPRMDMKMKNEVDTFVCPKCGREFRDWDSCRQHARARKHASFCSYDRESLPTCLNAHTMLPAHSTSGHCDIRGRRRVIEDFHTIELQTNRQFYGIFDGHSGNLASKYATSHLFAALTDRLDSVNWDEARIGSTAWADSIVEQTAAAFHNIHREFVSAVSSSTRLSSGSWKMDQSGTTATVMLVSSNDGSGHNESFVLVASLGDSRAVLSSRTNGSMTGIQLTTDHTASDAKEQRLVEERGGFVKVQNGVARVNGTLVVTRSIGDEGLSRYLSQTPDVFPFVKNDLLNRCGDLKDDPAMPCFVILASDGLWDTVSNDEAVWLVTDIVLSAASSWRENSSLQQAAEALVHEAFVRGSSDNIGVCVVALV